VTSSHETFDVSKLAGKSADGFLFLTLTGLEVNNNANTFTPTWQFDLAYLKTPPVTQEERFILTGRFLGEYLQTLNPEDEKMWAQFKTLTLE
jgi:hypothetical protein